MFLEKFFRNFRTPTVEKHVLDGILDNMVTIPAGSFLMGSNDGEDDESPIHNVLLDEFKLGKYVVTQAEWESVMDSRPWENLKFSRVQADCPAVNITWYEVREFIERLNNSGPHLFRLPTEAEWEYACRAGASNTFPYGVLKLNLHKYAWFYDNAFQENKMSPQPIGVLQANKWGLFDIQGNVYEWCDDWYRRNYYNKSRLYNPQGPRYGKYKVVRGGDWARTEYFLRIASRRHYTPHHKDSFIGFRLAMDGQNIPANLELQIPDSNRGNEEKPHA